MGCLAQLLHQPSTSLIMTAVIEMDRTLMTALRMSEALPGTEGTGSGDLHILYNESLRPVGYLVEKRCVDDAWESLEPRCFITTSHAEALRLLAAPFRELPVREGTAVTAS
jgi:hypothetical protein